VEELVIPSYFCLQHLNHKVRIHFLRYSLFTVHYSLLRACIIDLQNSKSKANNITGEKELWR
jgi:hypothetical protein